MRTERVKSLYKMMMMMKSIINPKLGKIVLNQRHNSPLQKKGEEEVAQLGSVRNKQKLDILSGH